jgi:integrase
VTVATIQQTHRLLSVALKDPVRKRKLSFSPVGDATLPRFERRSRKALLIDRKKLWTPDELQAVLAHTRDDRWYPVWHVPAATGMRRSEVCGLRSQSVDLERGVIIVDWKVVPVHNVLYEDDPTSESSIREPGCWSPPVQRGARGAHTTSSSPRPQPRADEPSLPPTPPASKTFRRSRSATTDSG